MASPLRGQLCLLELVGEHQEVIDRPRLGPHRIQTRTEHGPLHRGELLLQIPGLGLQGLHRGGMRLPGCRETAFRSLQGRGRWLLDEPGLFRTGPAADRIRDDPRAFHGELADFVRSGPGRGRQGLHFRGDVLARDIGGQVFRSAGRSDGWRGLWGLSAEH